jgi:hypothetical protein
MHFGVIQLGREPILYPLYEITKYLEENPETPQKIMPMRVGEYMEINLL